MNVLESFKKDESFLLRLHSIVTILRETGFLEFLRERAKPSIINNGSDAQGMAFQAARSIGYNEALDDILYFKERYMDIVREGKMPQMSFGAKERNVNMNYMNDLEAMEFYGK